MQIFATLDADLQPVQLAAPMAVLFWQRQDDGSYARTDHQAALIDIAGWDDDALALNRAQAVTVADPSAGELLAGFTLSVDDAGAITAEASFTPLAIEVARARQVAAAQAQYDSHRQSPMTWDFGAIHAADDAGTDLGPAGAQQLQMADASAKDWLAVTQTAALLASTGSGATVIPLRTVANVWVQTPASAVLAVFAAGDGTQVSAFQRQLAMRQRFGALKAAINAAADASACLAIDVTAGWPA